MPRTDFVLALLLASVTALTRVPFRARVLPTWDAVQFALALDEYDIVKHQPHPPGYILYVAAGRAVRALVGDPAEALAWLAIVATAVTIFLTYRLAWAFSGRAPALVAATTLAASPLFWLYGTVALPYAAEAALVVLVATLVWPVRLGRTGYVYASAVALGLAGGIRQSLLVLLLPLWLGVACVGVRRWRVVLGGSALLGLVTALWFVPMVWLTGGLGRYVTASLELYDSTVRATTIIDPGGGWRGNVRGLAEACLMGMGLLGPGLVWLAVRGAGRVRQWGAREWFFAGWLLPPLAVYTAVHFGQYAYLLAVLPAFYILTARWIVTTVAEVAGRWGVPARRTGLLAAVVASVVLAHTAFYVGAGPVDVPEPSAATSRLERWAVDLRAFYRFRLWQATARGLREQEGVITAYVTTIRRDFDAAGTALVTELGNPRSYPWFRHVGYYLPEFATYHLRLGGFSPGYLSSRHAESMAALAGPEIPLPSGVRRLVWVVDAWNPLVPRPPGLEERVLPYGRRLYVLVVDGRSVEHGGYRLTPRDAPVALGRAADSPEEPGRSAGVHVKLGRGRAQ